MVTEKHGEDHYKLNTKIMLNIRIHRWIPTPLESEPPSSDLPQTSDAGKELLTSHEGNLALPVGPQNDYSKQLTK